MRMETSDTAGGHPTVETLPPVTRFSLRAREAHVETLGQALALDLPRQIGQRAGSGDREALCLGPDEWLLTAPEGEAAAIAAAADKIYQNAPHALADISDRELRFRLSGPGAADIVAMGCPRDLRGIAPGQAVRTIFHGATVILWRDGEDDFRLDVWRSFAPHVRSLIATGIDELRAGL